MNLKNNNLSINIVGNELNYLRSFQMLEIARELSIYTTFFLVLIGLIGNFLIIFVFCQSRFRSNSSNVYLLCLAVNDSLFLLVHLIEDTVKNYERMFIHDNSHSNNSTNSFEFFFILLNITNRYDVACRLINYLRYVLRFISAYISKLFLNGVSHREKCDYT